MIYLWWASRPGLGYTILGVYDHPPDDPPTWLHSIAIDEPGFYDPGDVFKAAVKFTGAVDYLERKFGSLISP